MSFYLVDHAFQPSAFAVGVIHAYLQVKVGTSWDLALSEKIASLTVVEARKTRI